MPEIGKMGALTLIILLVLCLTTISSSSSSSYSSKATIDQVQGEQFSSPKPKWQTQNPTLIDVKGGPDSVLWVVQLSDLHFSVHHPDRAIDFKKFVGPALSMINPSLVLITGDLTGFFSVSLLIILQNFLADLAMCVNEFYGILIWVFSIFINICFMFEIWLVDFYENVVLGELLLFFFFFFFVFVEIFTCYFIGKGLK